VLAPMGLRLSPAKTKVVHLSEGFDFLGFHLQWRRKRGTSRWYVYTHGRASYFGHAVAKHVFKKVDDIVWWRVVSLLRERHHWGWKDVRRRFTTPPGSGCRSRRAGLSYARSARSRSPGIATAAARSPAPGSRDRLTAETVESPLRREVHGGFGEGPGETDREQSRHRAPGLLSDESGRGLRPPKGRTWGRGATTPVVKVTGSDNKRVSLAALIDVKPGHSRVPSSWCGTT
jgi:hypothetical protein